MPKFERNAKTWNKIHRKAAKIKSYDDKKKFMRYMKRLYEVIDCEVCRKHTGKFMRKYPMKEYLVYIDKDGKDRGLFRWTWIFHNKVNRRLNKREYGWREAVKLYYSD